MSAFQWIGLVSLLSAFIWTNVAAQAKFNVPCAQDMIMADLLKDLPIARLRPTTAAKEDQSTQRFSARPDGEDNDNYTKPNTGDLSPVIIPIIFQVFRDSDGIEGHIPYAALQNQIDFANEAYAGLQNENATNPVDTKIKFVLQGANYWDDTNMFENCETLDPIYESYRNLQVNSRYTINVVTCKMHTYSGWAHTCFCSEAVRLILSKGGVYVDYRYLPKYGDWDPVNFGGFAERSGDTFVHEVGHALGLFHPATESCTEPNDLVDDTPAQSDMQWEWGVCPADKDSCPTMPGFDMVTNFMDYSDDQCRNTFTVGQAKRMHWFIDTYQPTFREMSYDWGCVAKVFPSQTDQTEVALSPCKSPCMRTKMPNKKAAPKAGWCYYHGGNPDQSSQLWGECVCPGSSEQARLAPAAPTTFNVACVGKNCAIAHWTLGGDCPGAIPFGEAQRYCASRGFTLCPADAARKGAIKKAIAETPCMSSDIKELWTNAKCRKTNSRFVYVTATNKLVCTKQRAVAAPICCRKA